MHETKRVPVANRSTSLYQSGTGMLTAKELFDDGYVEDPYPSYRRFLDAGPVHYVNYRQGTWAIFSHADCSTAIRDMRLSARRTATFLLTLAPEQRAEFAELARLLGLWMLFIDAPEHTRLRKLMNLGFSPAVVESLRPQLEAIVNGMLEPLLRASEVDLMQAIAYPLPIRVIAEMLGIPHKMQDRLLEWTDAIARLFGFPYQHTAETLRPAQNAVLELTQFFCKATAERRKQKGSDLISLLLDIKADGDVLTDEEVHAQCLMLLFGGHETTRNLVGNGIYTLLRHPAAIGELRNNPGLIRSAVEELLRYESPVQYTARIAKEDMEICGVRLHAGEQILFMLGAANRDAAQFREPDRLDLKRVSNAHLAFGAGAHFCIGNQLARLEGQAAILNLLRRFPHMRLAQKRVEWLPNSVFRGLKSLPVAL
jgi:cytochrome P450